MLNESFVHLRVHSEYSLVDGLVRVKDLCKHTAALGMPAVALTDLCNFYALIKFQKAAQGAGIKPIYGSDLLLREDDDPEQISTLCLLVQNETGYHNLTDLISRAYLEGQWQGKACGTCPLVDADCVNGDLDRASCTCIDCRAPWSGPLCKRSGCAAGLLSAREY